MQKKSLIASFETVYHGEWSVCLARHFYCFFLQIFPSFFLQVMLQTFLFLSAFIYQLLVEYGRIDDKWTFKNEKYSLFLDLSKGRGDGEVTYQKQKGYKPTSRSLLLSRFRLSGSLLWHCWKCWLAPEKVLSKEPFSLIRNLIIIRIIIINKFVQFSP